MLKVVDKDNSNLNVVHSPISPCFCFLDINSNGEFLWYTAQVFLVEGWPLNKCGDGGALLQVLKHKLLWMPQNCVLYEVARFVIQ